MRDGNPKGLFNREAKGRATTPVEVEVERGQVRFFASVLGEDDPIHFNVEVARAWGYPDLVAPPSFFMAIEAMADDALVRRGDRTFKQLAGCDFRYLLHGEETYAYSGVVCAGDRLTVTSTIADFYDKKGGELEFVTVESVVEHPERGVLLRATRSMLHRLVA